jgi:hypothetical protein
MLHLYKSFYKIFTYTEIYAQARDTKRRLRASQVIYQMSTITILPLRQRQRSPQIHCLNRGLIVVEMNAKMNISLLTIIVHRARDLISTSLEF